MTILQVNGVNMPDPSSLELTYSDISSPNAGRTADGTMNKDKIAQKVKLSLAWNWLSMSDCATLFQAIDPIYFSVTYPDAKTGVWQTITCYVGDRTAPIYWVKNGVPGYQSVKFDLIQQ